MRDTTGSSGQVVENEVDEYGKAVTSIYHATNICFNIFEHLISVVNADSLTKHMLLVSDIEPEEKMKGIPRDVTGIRNSFVLWVDHTKALATAGASLDDMLQEDDKIKDTVVALLEMIERNLNRLRQNCGKNPTFLDEESQRWLTSIDSALNRLNELARAISKKSIKPQEELVIFTSNEDKVFHEKVIAHIKSKFPKARPSLREYMGARIVARRRTLMLKCRRANKSKATQNEGYAEVEYPDMPQTKPGETHFQCPYCLKQLQVTELKERNDEYWRLHINQDLLPYICPFTSCPGSMFAHQAHWSSHMAIVHSKEWPRKVHSRIWDCNLDHETPVEFNNETDWKTHMEDISLHKSRSNPLTGNRLDDHIVTKQQLCLREPFVCPFCEEKPKSFENPGGRGNQAEMESSLTSHIADHIRSLLLMALPAFDSEVTDAAKRPVGHKVYQKEQSKPLRKVLRESLITCALNKEKRFIPRRQLEMKCDIEAVARELKKAFPRSDPNFYEKLASLICHGQTRNSSLISKPCFKIFAILVLLDKARLIDYFQKHSVCDDDLPFYCTPDFGKMWSNKTGEKDYIKFPDGIDDEFIEAFARVQWSVLAPAFESPKSSSLRCNFYEFDDMIILPITNVSDNKHQGGFGLVEKVQLHEEHNGFKHSHFALKTIHSMMPFDLKDSFFRQELDAFQKAKPHSHLIEVCAAFKKGENYHFLFPWANGGTLIHLWNKRPQDIVTEKRVQWSEFSRWICEQCHGIFRDLLGIHEPQGQSQKDRTADKEDLYSIHSDIKPENILHFTEDGSPLGSLKVSDLGLMKFHRLISRTVQSKPMGAAYQTYRAPEHDMGMIRSRKIDIWAFGCLFAEFLTWAIAGQGGIEHFKTMRVDEDRHFPDKNKGEWFEDHFFTMRTGQPRRKQSVAKWFANLDEDLSKDTFFSQFFSFIQDSMLHPDRNARVEYKDVEKFLERCLENHADSSFWFLDGKLTEKYSYGQRTTGLSTWSQE